MGSHARVIYYIPCLGSHAGVIQCIQAPSWPTRDDLSTPIVGPGPRGVPSSDLNCNMRKAATMEYMKNLCRNIPPNFWICFCKQNEHLHKVDQLLFRADSNNALLKHIFYGVVGCRISSFTETSDQCKMTFHHTKSIPLCSQVSQAQT